MYIKKRANITRYSNISIVAEPGKYGTFETIQFLMQRLRNGCMHCIRRVRGVKYEMMVRGK
jgi:hypothetical protein